MGFLAWGRRLDDRLARRWSWFDRPMPANTRLGLLLLLIFGGQFLARLLFPSSFGGGSYDGFTVVYGIGAAAGVALLVAGHLKTRRGR